MIGEGVDHVGEAHRRRVDDDLVDHRPRGSLTRIETGNVLADRTRSVTSARRSSRMRLRQLRARGRPLTDNRLDGVSGQPLDVTHRDLQPLAHDPVDRAVGARPRRRADRVDVEHLTTADGSRRGPTHATRTGRRAAAAAPRRGTVAPHRSRPGAIASRPSTRSFTVCSPEPMCTNERSRRDTSWSSASSTCNDASNRSVSRHRSGSTTAWPRARAWWSTPARFTATRVPGPIDSTVRPAVWIERIRAVVDPGSVTTA